MLGTEPNLALLWLSQQQLGDEEKLAKEQGGFEEGMSVTLAISLGNGVGKGKTGLLGGEEPVGCVAEGSRLGWSRKV